jgi:hypothetical protein
MPRRWSSQFPLVLVVVFKDSRAEDSLALADLLSARVEMLGLVQVEEDIPLSRGNAGARSLRNTLAKQLTHRKSEYPLRVSVAYDSWDDLRAHIRRLKPNLVILDWQAFERHAAAAKTEILRNFPANLAVVHGKPPLKPVPGEQREAGSLREKPIKTLVPLRGGPHAQLALRLALALPDQEIAAIHFERPDESSSPLKGLERILPSLKEVRYEKRLSQDPTADILKIARQSDMLLLGANLSAGSTGPLIGQVAADLIAANPCPIVLVKSRRPEPRSYTGLEGELSGNEAISILVDKWFAENTFHASEFDNLSELVRRKQAQNLTVSLALPALNEEETVGAILSSIRANLIEKHPLLDEVVLIDSNSSDRTRTIASGMGVPVHIHQHLLPTYGARTGKGEALWKSLFVTRGDIVLWVDSDIVNFDPRFVYGVLGPLLLHPEIQFVKGFYQRPLGSGHQITPGGGGRVTELTARPLLNLFYPELSGVIQPLSGEYGGRRAALERLTFHSGYGVETGLLIDVYEKFGLSAIAQVDLLERIHHNQTLQALSKMSFVIIQTVLGKLEKRFHVPLLEDVNKSMKLIEYHKGAYSLEIQELIEQERPPMIDLPEYCQALHRTPATEERR